MSKKKQKENVMPQPIAVNDFYSDGRGPDLQTVIWGNRGVNLLAIEYFNPDDPYNDTYIRHVAFHGVQVVAITPEEVIDFTSYAAAFSKKAAAIDHGQSAWYRSFSPSHLGQCRHFQLLFYDELFDIICERITFARGHYSLIPKEAQ